MTTAMGRDIGIGTLMASTAWGHAWVLQVAVALVGVASVAIGGAKRSTWKALSIVVALLAVSVALGGHAAATRRGTTAAVATDALHVIGAAGWLGSLAFVAIIGLPAARSGGAGEQGPLVRSLVNAFSPLALGFAGLVVATGAINAVLRVGSVAALTQTTYGRVLLVKLLATYAAESSAIT